ncbi:MAG: bifunctional methylenetetrahydrofolate dehydrogenase/methenyltetrahydrofolate cyclohydrolase FolD [archaeon]|nr:bifunctional methylenetetrahydrofolate dehydrogenase/methenyltetrahydrofolate cyclohydrolase FolD [archaeon]MDA0842383.1 bifunctional methylenetetrahydrofolate dehydrogenase/methenyltetrahydrofolate cyclohydrolase FolD [archaeon]MDA1167937.1 bifunctional methylenetetrahydrofolate dehydrogenase/methenyltetrahydrofolate cyclohydrolase FolD [archaeon]
MGAQRLDGKQCASSIEANLLLRIEQLSHQGVVPHLAVIIVGDDPASHVYVNSKIATCKRLGIQSTHIELPSNIGQNDLIKHVIQLNEDESVHGILIQSPLPQHMDEEAMTDLIDPTKDVDGFHPTNLGRLVQGRLDGMIPCTPHGVLRLLEWSGVQLRGKKAVVIGRSRIVGMPLSLLFASRGIDLTVTVAHSRTEDLAKVCAEADVLVAAVGIPELVQPQWVKSGAVVVDVGINRVEDSTHERGWRLAGDVNPSVSEVASWLSPVPGGVGPMTIAMLMENTVRSAELMSSNE